MGVDAEMFCRVTRPLTDVALRIESARLTEAFGPERFFLWKEDGRHALTWANVEDLDVFGVPNEGRTIRVSLADRYYGPGYERGDWPTLAAIAEWCRVRLGGPVWYGGDSGGPFVKLDGEGMATLWQHFYTHGHEPYRAAFDRILRRCCAFCQRPMHSVGGGAQVEFIACASCGDQWVVRKTDGMEYLVPRGENFFQVSQRVQVEGVIS